MYIAADQGESNVHKGRIYPYSPHYWATEGWFWPGFVPWKMFGTYSGGGTDWEPYIAPQIFGPSKPSVVSTSQLLITYDWVLSPPNIATLLRVRLQAATFSGVRWCRWQAALNVGSVTVALVYQFQPYPQRIVQTSNFLWTDVDDPTGSTGGPLLLFGPANYADGGSPWP